jgi:predicted DNA-binding protein YlxM (UPF0122 family)
MNTYITDDKSTLNIADIKQDITKCTRMINRAGHKMHLYERKLAQLLNPTKKEHSTLKKGLQLLRRLTRTTWSPS